jgi:tripartite-type tricarboxylate transporter receptor subunit TctC
MFRASLTCLLATIGMFGAIPNIAWAESLPSGPIRIVVGFGPGSTADIVARVVSQAIQQKLKTPVTVDNRPGNGSMLAAEMVERQPPDGLTLFMATVAQTIVPAYNKLPFRADTDLAPISLLGVVPNILVAHPSVPVKNVRELVDYARAHPDSLTFGNSGIGTASHLAAELFNMKAGTHIASVPYQGGSNQALTDLLAGRITLMFNVAATLAPFVRDHQLQALGAAQPERVSIMPDLPTMAEQGMPGFDAGIWIGLFAPPKTPAPILEALAEMSSDAIKTEDSAKVLKSQGIEPLGSTPAAFAKQLVADREKWESLVAGLAPH